MGEQSTFLDKPNGINQMNNDEAGDEVSLGAHIVDLELPEVLTITEKNPNQMAWM